MSDLYVLGATVKNFAHIMPLSLYKGGKFSLQNLLIKVLFKCSSLVSVTTRTEEKGPASKLGLVHCIT